MEHLKVVIGTRTYLGPGFFHIDIDSTPLYCKEDGTLHPVDLVCNAESIPLPDGCAQEVFSSEAIEHFSWRKTGDVIAEWCRLLEPKGKIRIEAPDFLAACQQILSGEDTAEFHIAMNQIFYAEQLNPNDFHYAGLTPRTLVFYLAGAGMQVTNIERGYECGWLRVDAIKPG